MRDAQQRTVEDTWRQLGPLLTTIEFRECDNYYIRNAGSGPTPKRTRSNGPRHGEKSNGESGQK